jgi:hypothetical protein
MTVTLQQLIDDPNTSDKDREDYKVVLDRYKACDVWANKIHGKVGVLLTSHPGNRAFLKASAESHKQLGFWMVLAYDNYLDPSRPDLEWNHIMPYRDVTDMFNTILVGPHQTWGGVLYPYFWLLRIGVEALNCFDYIYCANGDCVLEKPENFPALMDMLGDGDIMGCGWEDNGSRPIFNTTGFIAKSKAASAIMKHFQDHLIPLAAYEESAPTFGNTEGRFARAILDLGLKVVKVPTNPNDTQLSRSSGTWYEKVGFRHIHGEYNKAYRYKLVPPETKYLDSRYFNKAELDLLDKYHETKDQKVLEEWWAK